MSFFVYYFACNLSHIVVSFQNRIGGIFINKFAKSLKYLRKQANLTQAELSQKTGISRSALSNYEASLRLPDYETAEVIADFFNVNLDTLIGRDTADVNETYASMHFTAEEVQLIQYFRLLPKADRGFVYDMISAALKSRGIDPD